MIWKKPKDSSSKASNYTNPMKPNNYFCKSKTFNSPPPTETNKNQMKIKPSKPKKNKKPPKKNRKLITHQNKYNNAKKLSRNLTIMKF